MLFLCPSPSGSLARLNASNIQLLFILSCFFSLFLDLFYFILANAFSPLSLSFSTVPHAVCFIFTQKLCIFYSSAGRENLLFNFIYCSLLSPQSQFNDFFVFIGFCWINKRGRMNGEYHEILLEWKLKNTAYRTTKSHSIIERTSNNDLNSYRMRMVCKQLQWYIYIFMNTQEQE